MATRPRVSAPSFGCRRRLSLLLAGLVYASGLSRRPALSGRKLRFKGLCPDEFMHPWDLQNRQRLETVGPLARLGDWLVPILSGAVRDDLEARELRATGRRWRTEAALLEEAAFVLDVRTPDLYVRQNPTPNAYAFSSWQAADSLHGGSRPFIVLTSGLLDLLQDEEELQSVLAHELGHIKCDHARFMCVAQLVTSCFGLVGGPGMAEIHRRMLLQWQRCAELSSDRCALLVAQDSKVVISALEKLSLPLSRLRSTGARGLRQLTTKANARREGIFESYEGFQRSSLGERDAWDRLQSGDVFALLDIVIQTGKTHPHVATRVNHVFEYAQSKGFESLLWRGDPLQCGADQI